MRIRKALGNTDCRGALLYQVLPVLIGTDDLLYSSYCSRFFESASDFQLLTTDRFQRALHLLNHAQIGWLGQLVDGLHVVMEFGEGRFCGLQIVGHNIHILLFVPELATISVFLMFKETEPVTKVSFEIIGADISNV